MQTVPGEKPRLSGTWTSAPRTHWLAVILVGERLASAPGAFRPVPSLAQRTSAPAWRGCRGEPVARRARRRRAADTAARWTAGDRRRCTCRGRTCVGRLCATAPGRTRPAGILELALPRRNRWVGWSSVPSTRRLRRSEAAEASPDPAGFVVSLEIRRSAVTEQADVVLPVAPAAEKAGRYVTWEGRRRPFDLTLTATRDDVRRPRAERAGRRTRRRPRTEHRGSRAGELVAPGGPPPARPARACAAASQVTRALVLATWHELLDAGRLQDGDEHLAGTAKPARAALSRGHRGRAGRPDRAVLVVSTGTGRR